ncbi:MAG: SdiA-regulated domain-containing protein [Ginsengibacter sp.]
MRIVNLLVVLLWLATFTLSSGCSSADKKNYTSPAPYDLNQPEVIKLPTGLNEISGMAYYPKDTSVFAIIDEDGLFFKIYLRNPPLVKSWRFDKKHDFEDVVLHDSTFYVLISNGDVETLKFEHDSVLTKKSKFGDADKKINEFESLYYDENFNQLVMVCKNCEDDKKKEVSAWGYMPDSQKYTPAIFSIDVRAIDKEFGEEKIHLKPSATAVDPKTNELYILASVNKLLVIADRKGNVKQIHQLDPDIFNQPEGIAFTPNGDLLISNEKGEKSNATILIYKYK